MVQTLTISITWQVSSLIIISKARKCKLKNLAKFVFSGEKKKKTHTISERKAENGNEREWEAAGVKMVGTINHAWQESV